MTRWEVVVFVAMVLVMSGLPSKAVAEEKSEEKIPKTSAWRQRPSSSSSSSGVKPSYDLSEAYNVMAANRMGVGSGFSNGGFSRGGGTSKSSRDGYDSLDAGDTQTHYYESYSQPTGYGGYPSESGYGLSCASGYVNASAVALLAFLFLLNIVQVHRFALHEISRLCKMAFVTPRFVLIVMLRSTRLGCSTRAQSLLTGCVVTRIIHLL